MNKCLLITLFVLTGIFNASADEKFKDVDDFQSDGKLVYFRSIPVGASNSSQIEFTFYNYSLEKIDTKLVSLEGIKANFCSLFHLEKEEGKMKVILLMVSEKRFGGRRSVVAISEDYKLLYVVSGENKSESFEDYNDEYFAGSRLKKLPEDHFLEATLCSNKATEFDAYTREGGVIYLHYDIDVSSFPPPLSQMYAHSSSKNNSKLFYYLPDSGTFLKKWEFDIQEEAIILYKVYETADKVFLYTFYSEGEDKSKRYFQKIRCIDKFSGEMIYGISPVGKENYSFLLGKMSYDSISDQLFIVGNYFVLESKMELVKSGMPSSFLCIEKINGKGEIVQNVLSVDSWENKGIPKKNIRRVLILSPNI